MTAREHLERIVAVWGDGTYRLSAELSETIAAAREYLAEPSPAVPALVREAREYAEEHDGEGMATGGAPDLVARLADALEASAQERRYVATLRGLGEDQLTHAAAERDAAVRAERERVLAFIAEDDLGCLDCLATRVVGPLSCKECGGTGLYVETIRRRLDAERGK